MFDFIRKWTEEILDVIIHNIKYSKCFKCKENIFIEIFQGKIVWCYDFLKTNCKYLYSINEYRSEFKQSQEVCQCNE